MAKSTKNKKGILKVVGAVVCLAVVGAGAGLVVKHWEPISNFFVGIFKKDDPKPSEDTVQAQFKVEGEETITKLATKNGLLQETIEDPVKEGYTFLGWVVEGTNELVNLEEYIFTGDITFVAIFEEEAETLPFTFFNGVLTGFTDTTITDVVIPASYSIRNKVTETRTIESKDALIVYLRENTLTSIDIVDANNTALTVNKVGLWREEYSIAYPVTLEHLVSCEYLEGTDIAVTGIGTDDSSPFQFTEITSVTIPGSIKSLSTTFLGCDSLTKVTLAEGFETIGYEAFSDCSNLKEISLPSTLKTIDENAFARCTSLENLVIPESTTRIEISSFKNCTNLTITFEGNPLITRDPVECFNYVKAIYVKSEYYDEFVHQEPRDLSDKTFVIEEA